MKVYSSFASDSQRKKYVCKSDISRELLREIHIPDFITVDEAKRAFDDITERNFILVKVGSKSDPKRRRTTKFVTKFALYQEIVKGLR